MAGQKIHPAVDGFESSKLLGGFSIQRFRLGQSFRSEKTKTRMRFSNRNRGEKSHLQKVAFRSVTASLPLKAIVVGKRSFPIGFWLL